MRRPLPLLLPLLLVALPPPVATAQQRFTVPTPAGVGMFCNYVFAEGTLVSRTVEEKDSICQAAPL